MMNRCACLALLALAIPAQAGTSWIELVPDTPGPYQPGSSVDVDVHFHNMVGHEIQIRLLTLDFSATDSRTKSTSVFACVFSMTLARCDSTVRVLIFRSCAMTLFDSPETMRSPSNSVFCRIRSAQFSARSTVFLRCAG